MVNRVGEPVVGALVSVCRRSGGPVGPARELNGFGASLPGVKRLFPLLLGLAVAAAACGVERESDDTLAVDAEVSESSSPQGTGNSDDDSSSGTDESATTVAPSTATTLPTTPPTTAPAGDVALTAQVGDETIEITHGEMNELAVSTAESQEFVDLALGGVYPPGFELNILTEQLVSRALELQIGEAGASVSDADLDESRVRLLDQVATLYPASADPLADAERLYDDVPYLQFLARYQAGQDVLTAAVIDGAEPGEGNPCVSHILLESETDAQGALDRLADGEDFAELAIELSTGPSGPNGGDLGCAPSTNYVGPFAEAVDSAEIGEFVGPVETEFGFHVLVVERYEVDGRTLAANRLRSALGEATVDVDERLGVWDPTQLAVLPLP